jgi:hypothetical protein
VVSASLRKWTASFKVVSDLLRERLPPHIEKPSLRRLGFIYRIERRTPLAASVFPVKTDGVPESLQLQLPKAL